MRQRIKICHILCYIIWIIFWDIIEDICRYSKYTREWVCVLKIRVTLIYLMIQHPRNDKFIKKNYFLSKNSKHLYAINQKWCSHAWSKQVKSRCLKKSQWSDPEKIRKVHPEKNLVRSACFKKDSFFFLKIRSDPKSKKSR